MIVVKIKGGLGNQMFEYAMARKIQTEFGIRELILDPYPVNRDRLRNFGLDSFRLGKNVAVGESGSVKGILKLQEDIAARLVSYFIAGRREEVAIRREKRLEKLFYLLGIIQKDHCAGTTGHFLLKLHKNIYMNGWFQEAKEIAGIREKLLDEFQFVREMPRKVVEFGEKIEGSEAVCMHIRRGDYVNHPQFGVCTDSYYYRAMDEMAGRTDHPVFYIFSDSMEAVKTMQFKYPVVFDEVGESEHESLYLMSKCRHFIISNSTFSWWAQFLARDEKKIVIAPDRWYNEGYGSATQYLDDWILLEV